MTRSIPRPARYAIAIALLVIGATPLAGQQGATETRSGRAVPIDTARARTLYVSNRWEDHDPDRDHARDMAGKARTDSVYAARSKGVMDYSRITYRSRIGDMDIPAYVFQPIQKRGPRGHAAMIWVHGGVHGNWGENMFPFVREAIERGYVVIAPEYRGSTGYGEVHHNAIDYGGFEIDDVLTAYDWVVSNLPHVDPDRVGIMGWSHGGFITLHSVFRDEHPFKAAAGIVPVTNLIFRLSYKGPGYQRGFATQQRIGGLPFEKREEYVARSPYYHVHRLEVPLLVHVATNDDDVNFEEASMLIWALRAQKPNLTETEIYTDPPSGHSFSRRVNRETLERMDTPEQRDSWNRTWAFFERHLQPYR
ncbi:MAG: prolyl oligopeptidase family serine peptidase [Gemmatimonadetes bacterium]|nr:prolyl oligopeptidase family serine peptidase [Gemmatimonadota bacterium]